MRCAHCGNELSRARALFDPRSIHGVRCGVCDQRSFITPRESLRKFGVPSLIGSISMSMLMILPRPLIGWWSIALGIVVGIPLYLYLFYRASNNIETVPHRSERQFHLIKQQVVMVFAGLGLSALLLALYGLGLVRHISMVITALAIIPLLAALSFVWFIRIQREEP